MKSKIVKVGLELLVLSVITKSVWGACKQMEVSHTAVKENISELLDCEPIKISVELQQEAPAATNANENASEASNESK